MNGSRWGAAAWVASALLLFPPGHLDAQAPEAPPSAEPSSADSQTQEPAVSVPTDTETPPRIETADLVQAIIESRRTLQLQPNSIETRSRLALLLYQLGDVDGSIEEYRAILAFHDDSAQGPDLAQVHVALASALMAKQEWRAAQTELTEALRIRPEMVQAHTSLGAVRYTLGDVTGAIHAYEEALQLRPEFADAHYHLGLLLKVTRREAEAAREFRAAAEAGLPKAQYFLGTAYIHGHGVEKDETEALSWWLRASEQGYQPATEALAQWRQETLGRTRRSAEEQETALKALEEAKRRLRAD
jgi:Tfp pilus assembly protein PilF